MRSRLLAVLLAVSVAACAGEPPPPTLPAEVGTLAVPPGAYWFRIARAAPVAASAGVGALRIWSLPEGSQRRAIDLGDRQIDALAISPDGATVVVGDHAGGLTAWKTATGEVVFDRQLARYPGFGLLTFSPDSSRLAIGVQGDPVQVVTADGSPVTTLESALGGTWAIAFSPDNARIATGGGDGSVRIHDARSGALVAENRDLLMTVLAVAFTSDGSSVIVGSGDKVLTFVDATTGQATRRLARTAQPVAFIEVSPEGQSMATMFMKTENLLEPDRVRVTDIETGHIRLDWLPSALPAGGGWMSDGRLILAVPSPDGLKLWRVY